MAKWLLLLYRLPRTPSAPRMAIWRALKRLDGEYLQDGVYAIKATQLNAETLGDLAHDIRNYGGEANVATTAVDDERHFSSRLKAAADAARVVVKLPRNGSKKRVKRS